MVPNSPRPFFPALALALGKGCRPSFAWPFSVAVASVSLPCLHCSLLRWSKEQLLYAVQKLGMVCCSQHRWMTQKSNCFLGCCHGYWPPLLQQMMFWDERSNYRLTSIPPFRRWEGCRTFDGGSSLVWNWQFLPRWLTTVKAQNSSQFF